ncbi:hypothetical protein [Microbacterium rhizophilus]|uniref:hypothetical protein n=1 Tax=Microbacterium rhizophilus TaxID=3138934 RepID=UPI0031EF486C
MSEHERVYTEVPGTICHVQGERGTVTGLTYEGGIHRRAVGAFVHLDERDVMLYVTLGIPVTGPCDCGADAGRRTEHRQDCAVVSGRLTHHLVSETREITRDEFDRLTGLDTVRTDCGWRTRGGSLIPGPPAWMGRTA